MKLFTVQGALALSSAMPMSPTLVEMVALITGGSVDTLPDGGGVAGLSACSCVGGYWQLTPRSAGGAKAGSAGTGAPGPAPGLGALVCAGNLIAVLVAVVDDPLPPLWVTRVITSAITAPSTRTDPPTMPKINRREFAGWGCGGDAAGPGSDTGGEIAGAAAGGMLHAAVSLGPVSAALAACASSMAVW